MDQYVSQLHTNEIDSVFDAILTLKDREECYRFFQDICTVTELQSIAQRWEVARQLDKGVTYQDISKSLNASTATISRVNRSLSYGAGGYRMMLERMRKED